MSTLADKRYCYVPLSTKSYKEGQYPGNLGVFNPLLFFHKYLQYHTMHRIKFAVVKVNR